MARRQHTNIKQIRSYYHFCYGNILSPITVRMLIATWAEHFERTSLGLPASVSVRTFHACVVFGDPRPAITGGRHQIPARAWSHSHATWIRQLRGAPRKGTATHFPFSPNATLRTIKSHTHISRLLDKNSRFSNPRNVYMLLASKGSVNLGQAGFLFVWRPLAYGVLALKCFNNTNFSSETILWHVKSPGESEFPGF